MLNWSCERLKNIEPINPQTRGLRRNVYREDLEELFKVLQEVGWQHVGSRLHRRFEKTISRQWKGSDPRAQ